MSWARAGLLLLAALLPLPAFGAGELPAGFEQRAVLAGVREPTDVAWTPDGAMWVTGKLGPIWVVRSGTPSVALTLDVTYEGERGVGSIAVDPDFVSNSLIWIYYTTPIPVPHNRLSHFRADGDRLTDEVVVFEGPTVTAVMHNGGGLRFAADKTLFLSIGEDDQKSVTAQDPHDLRGKLLHLNRDGTPAADNPFRDGRDGHPLVWALGLRNPFRIAVQPGSGALFIGDVGAGAWEELDLGIVGANYGWGEVEGPQPPGVSGFVYPIYAYPHDNPVGNAIIAGGFVPEGNFPAEYVGNFFFGDEPTGRIFRMTLDASDRPISTGVWATDVGFPSALEFGPDGALYMVDYYGGAVVRIAYNGAAAHQPVALAKATPDNGTSPLSVTLDATASYDPDGGALSYNWDFGDGSGSREAAPVHLYPRGVFHPVLEVANARGIVSRVSDLVVVSGNHRPRAVIQKPANEARYTPDTEVKFSGTGRDREDIELDCSKLEWRVLLHHVPPGGTTGHTHPWLGPLTGVCYGSFVAKSHEENNVYYEIILTVKDRGTPIGPEASLTGTRSIVVRPVGR